MFLQPTLCIVTLLSRTVHPFASFFLPFSFSFLVQFSFAQPKGLASSDRVFFAANPNRRAHSVRGARFHRSILSRRGPGPGRGPPVSVAFVAGTLRPLRRLLEAVHHRKPSTVVQYSSASTSVCLNRDFIVLGRHEEMGSIRVPWWQVQIQVQHGMFLTTYLPEEVHGPRAIMPCLFKAIIHYHHHNHHSLDPESGKSFATVIQPTPLCTSGLCLDIFRSLLNCKVSALCTACTTALRSSRRGFHFVTI